jgi:hypothetical protein
MGNLSKRTGISNEKINSNMKVFACLILLPFMLLLTSCFYLERVVDYDVKGCEDPNLFCMADFPYTQEEVGDSVVPYHKYFVVGIKNSSDYGIFLPKHVKKGTSLEYASLVDEHGQKVKLMAMLKKEQEQIKMESKNIFLNPSQISDFYISVLTPSIPSYEIEFRFEKKDGSVHVFSFKMNQEENHKFRILLFDLLAG